MWSNFMIKNIYATLALEDRLWFVSVQIRTTYNRYQWHISFHLFQVIYSKTKTEPIDLNQSLKQLQIVWLLRYFVNKNTNIFIFRSAQRRYNAFSHRLGCLSCSKMSTNNSRWWLVHNCTNFAVSCFVKTTTNRHSLPLNKSSEPWSVTNCIFQPLESIFMGNTYHWTSHVYIVSLPMQSKNLRHQKSKFGLMLKLVIIFLLLPYRPFSHSLRLISPHRKRFILTKHMR